jgi:hypothetical protein
VVDRDPELLRVRVELSDDGLRLAEGHQAARDGGGGTHPEATGLVEEFFVFIEACSLRRVH